MQVNNKIHRAVESLLNEIEGNKTGLKINYWENSAKIQWKRDVGTFIYPKFINIEILITLPENEDES